ncbi:MAG: hypothetical protein DME26_03430, partial [Verrucomicrobia bacterium]
MWFLATRAPAAVNVLTYHNDEARTGQNLQETKLTPVNVNTNSFGKWFSYAVDGYVFAQPLILTDVDVPGKGTRNLVFVVTQHDSVYAFDADSNADESGDPIWHVNFTDPDNGITTFPTGELGFDDPPEIGITSTPALDPDSETLYVVAKTKEVTSVEARYVATVPGSGAGNDGKGRVLFDSFHQFQRAGLVLRDGVVQVTFASAGDIDPYHGWILGYDSQTLQTVRVFNDTPNGGEGGIWMSGAAPAVDTQGDLYCITGNGSFDPGRGNFGDSFLRLTPSNASLIVTDYFTPFNQADLASRDLDLGTGGALLLPDEAGSPEHPHLVVGCGKEGVIYLVDRDRMGHFSATDDSQIVQTLRKLGGGHVGTAAYFNGWLYIQGSYDYLKAFQLTDGRLSTQPVSQSAYKAEYPNVTPSISANGTENGIVWIVQTDTFYQNAPPILRAYNATDLTEEIYNSSLANDRDRLGGRAMRFTVPVIANGKVYVASANSLTILGNLEPPTIIRPPSSQVVIVGGQVALEVRASGSPPFSYQWQFAGNAIYGATNAVLAWTNATSGQTGRYTIVVSNAFGAVTNAEAIVIVAEPPKLKISQDLELSLTARGGLVYRIEYLDDLDASGDWQTL